MDSIISTFGRLPDAKCLSIEEGDSYIRYPNKGWLRLDTAKVSPLSISSEFHEANSDVHSRYQFMLRGSNPNRCAVSSPSAESSAEPQTRWSQCWLSWPCPRSVLQRDARQRAR